jgi:hypothetical protein
VIDLYRKHSNSKVAELACDLANKWKAVVKRYHQECASKLEALDKREKEKYSVSSSKKHPVKVAVGENKDAM